MYKEGIGMAARADLVLVKDGSAYGSRTNYGNREYKFSGIGGSGERVDEGCMLADTVGEERVLAKLYWSSGDLTKIDVRLLDAKKPEGEGNEGDILGKGALHLEDCIRKFSLREQVRACERL